MGARTAERSAVTEAPREGDAALPWPGLLRVLSDYTGRGQLYAAMASSSSQHDWAPVDVRRRARRILFERNLAVLSTLPTREAEWVEALPAELVVERLVSPTPAGRIDWSSTRLLSWPPTRGLVIRRRRRVADRNLAELLVWTATRLQEVAGDAASIDPELVLRGLVQIRVLQDAAARLSVEGVAPDRALLAAASHSGPPWPALARLAQALKREDSDLEWLARELLLPDPLLRGRLFQLGCLGVLLDGLRAQQWRVISVRPIGVGIGPVYRAEDPAGDVWDIWVETAGFYNHYGWDSPYLRLTGQLPVPTRPVGADLALVRRDRQAFVFECKYSSDLTYVLRDGYHQAMSYMVEAASHVPHVEAVIIGPDDVVPHLAHTDVEDSTLAVLGPSEISAWVQQRLDAVR
jgi:hypothetical protein